MNMHFTRQTEVLQSNPYLDKITCLRNNSFDKYLPGTIALILQSTHEKESKSDYKQHTCRIQR
jgi:hypothetical protein